jgi:hypothetical protein
MQLTSRQYAIPVDMDGNHLAKFWGYDCPTKEEIFGGIPNAVKIMVYTSKGFIVQAVTKPT